MDASKGRLVFAGRHPGYIPNGTANFRIAPEKNSTDMGRHTESKEGVSRNNSNLPTGRSALHSKHNGRECSQSWAQFPEDAPASTDAEYRRMAQQIFGHYSAIG